MNFRHLLIALLIVLETGCKTSSSRPEVLSGVSLELARQRKAILSHISYNIQLDIPSDVDQPVRASEQISFDLSDPTADLQIDFKENPALLKSLVVNGKSTGINHQNEHIIVPHKLLIKGRNHIRIVLEAGNTSLNRNPEFLYTLLVPDRARTFLPCFDQPDLKASFTLTAAVPSDWEVISNGKMKAQQISSGQKTCQFEPSDTISTYLFAIVAGKFQKVSRNIHDREINFYHRETDTAKISQSIDPVFELHGQSLEFMENYTGIPYPFLKLDLIAVPDFPYGGMEHVGAIDYRASTLFLDRSATQDEQIARASTIAHETAHMWFGNLVTMEWFNDVWMKEVFANFMADKIVGKIMPDTNGNFRFLLGHHPGAYAVDRTEGANPIRQELSNLNQAGTLYGNIIYKKAPIVMKQLEKICGENKMQQGLREYLETYAFKNASWTELIKILDRISPENLEQWNEQWINQPGRPALTYNLRISNGTIAGLSLSQKGEYPSRGTWKQHFNLALVYENEVRLIPIYMDRNELHLKQVEGMEAPLFVLFNATGEGYGSFPVDRNMLTRLNKLQQPVMRASAYLNIYDEVLNGNGISPQDLLNLYGKAFDTEQEEQIVSRMSKQFRNIYWQFITPATRQQLNAQLENDIWKAMEKSRSKGKKRILFQTYVSIALSQAATDRLYRIWSTEKAPERILLSEEDYVDIATELVIRKHPEASSILSAQLKRIQNADRRAGFTFVLPALSNDIQIRDSFFATLADKSNREKEVWVTEALEYLHHPLRTAESEKYLPKTLELLEEIQMTGDIFFPSDWLYASLCNYQTESAASIVRTFLQQHPDYNQNLRRKILQEADDLFRATLLS